MASKKGAKFTIQGEVLLRANLAVDQVEAQIQKINQGFNNFILGDKSTKNLEGTVTRIKDQMMALRAQSAKGFLDSDELNEYYAQSKKLTKEQDSLARMMRSMPDSQIILDSAELRKAQDEIVSAREALESFKKTLEFDTSGYGDATEEIIRLSDQMVSAAKNSKSVQEAFDGIRRDRAQRLAAASGKEGDRQAEKKEADERVQALTEEYEAYKKLNDEIKDIGKSGKYSDGLVEALKGAKKFTEGKEGLAGLTTNDEKKAKAAELAKNQYDKLEAATTAAKKASQEHGKAVAKTAEEAKKLQAIDQFGQNNATKIDAFENQAKDLAIALTKTEKEARVLYDTLIKMSQQDLDALAQELEKVSAQEKLALGGVEDHEDALKKEKAATDSSVASFKSKITQLFGLYNIYQLIRRGINDAYQSIKKLDTAMNEIAVVTSMTTNQLWGQIDTYMAVAKQYGVATQGVYEVSKLYYQQGRQAAEVTLLTAETLKMAKIAGLDYSKATDNMTVALNGFKMSAQDASTIVDVYSKLAAVAAVDTEELAYAMSKTASIAESAGMSFENTSVFLTQMIETTREAPENIGTALKTIIARFQEMKKSPMDIIDVEGEEVSFNKVDQALKTIGMSLQDTSGQFRDLDGVIYELADKWDSLDRNTQRYIATTVAGSRQQSRFLALMQDNSRLQELRVKATESEDAGLIQYSKTLDSLDSKLNQLSTSFQELYMGIINGPIVKTFIDGIRFIIDNLNSLPKAVSLTLLPAIFLLVRKLLTTIGSQLISGTRDGLQKARAQWSTYFKSLIAESKTTGATIQANLTNVPPAGAPVRNRRSGRMSGSGAGGQGQGQALTGLGGFASVQATTISQIYIVIAIISAFAAAVEFLSTSVEEHVERLKKTAEDANIERAIAKDELTSLTQLKKKYDELNKIQNKTQEQTEEYNAIRTEIADKYPELIDYIDEEGIAVLNMVDAYETLRQAKQAAYDQAFIDNAKAQMALARDVTVQLTNMGVDMTQDLWESSGAGPALQRAIKNAQNSKDYKNGKVELIDLVKQEFAKDYKATFDRYGNILDYTNTQTPGDFLKVEDVDLAFKQLELAVQKTAVAFEAAKKIFIGGQVGLALSSNEIYSDLASYKLQKEGGALFTQLDDDNPSWSDEKLENEFYVRFAQLINEAIENDYSSRALKSSDYQTAEGIFSQKDTMSRRQFDALAQDSNVQAKLGEEQYTAVDQAIEDRYQQSISSFSAMLAKELPDYRLSAGRSDVATDLTGRFEQLQDMTNDRVANYFLSVIESGWKILKNPKDVEKSVNPQKLLDNYANNTADLFDQIFQANTYDAGSEEYASMAGQLENLILQYDPNTVTGVIYLFDALGKLDGLDTSNFAALKTARLDYLIPTANEVFEGFNSYIAALLDVDKMDFNNVSFDDYQKLIKEYGFTEKDFDFSTPGKVQFADPQDAKNIILGVNKVLYDTLVNVYGENSEWVEQFRSNMEQEKKQNSLSDALGALDFSDEYNEITNEQFSALEEVLGANFKATSGSLWQDTIGGKRINSDSYGSMVDALTDLLEETTDTISKAFIKQIIDSLTQQMENTVEDMTSNVISGLDPEKNRGVFDKATLDWLGISTDFATAIGFDKYVVGNIDYLLNILRQKLIAENTDPTVINNIIADQKKEQAEFLEDQAKALSDALLSMLDANAEELISQANSNQFKDENLAKALAGRMGKKSVTKTDEGSSIDGATQDKNIEQIEDYFISRGKNLYDTMTLVAETEGQLDNIAKLQKELTDARLKGGQREIVLARQLAAVIHDTMVSAESYDFMGNSQTNNQLAPMYALMQSTQTAVTALQEASKSGKISTESLNAMLDFVGRDKTQFKALDKLSKQLKPPLETEMSAEDAAMMEEAIKQKQQERVEEYNKYADRVNSYIDTLTTQQDDKLWTNPEDQKYRYQGEQVQSISQILESLEIQVPTEEFQKLLGIGMQNGGTVDSFMEAFASQGYIEKIGAQETATDANTEAVTGLTKQLENTKLQVETDTKDAAAAMQEAKTSITTNASLAGVGLSRAAQQAESFATRLSNIKLVVGGGGKNDSSTVDPLVEGEGGSAATGGLLKKSTQALVGEFGPEIAVVDGKYYLVGKNGPERVNLPQGSFVMNHQETAKVFGKPTRSLGDSFALSDYKLEKVSATFGGSSIKTGGGGGGSDSGAGEEDEPSKADFDRWYNYLRLIEDVEQAVTLLQAARENLSGAAYTQSQVNEIALLQQKAWQVNRLRDAQKEYLSTVNANKIKEYGDVLSVVNGVLQIHWDKLQGMDQDAAEPIQNIISEWEELNSSIHDSSVELENFKKQIKDLENAMRDTYLDVETQIIEAIKYRQQMIIKNLQDELTMKQKYDNKYLESLRKNIEKERKLRDRSDSEANRVTLQRKLALLKRDTSGKSDLAIAETERELREANRDAYDQRQDDYMQAEEDAALAAQEALQLEIEIQTEVLTMMGENVQLIQETVDDLLQSGPINLADFLANWNASYLNSTPIQQQKFIENTLGQAGQATAYLKFIAENIKPDVQPTNVGTWMPTTANGTGAGSANTTQAPASAAPASAGGDGSNSNTNQKYWGIYSGGKRIRNSFRTQASAQNTINSEVASASNAMYGLRWNTGSQAYKAAEAKYKQYKNATVQQYKSGGLIDYTGPAIVHGSKRKPESVLNARQTPIFQRFVDILDENFGGSTQRSMMKEAPRPNLEGAGTTVVVENINLQPGVISRDYDARRAGDLVKEEILNIAKYKGNMKIGKK